MSNTKLVKGRLDTPLAWLSKPLTGLPVGDAGQIVSRGNFLAHATLLARQLPDQAYVLNLCDNRYLFLVAAWAAILSKQTNLLPPNKNAATQSQLSKRYEDAYVIHDGHPELAAELNAIDISTLDWSLADFSEDVPHVDLNHPAIISFTSGSTGDPKPNLKTWRTLEQSSAINVAHMQPDSSDAHYHLATVPAQHMWGLETSVLIPVFTNACLVDARPMFPKDIRELLHRMPSPRTLISTPLHLRALSVAEQTPETAPIVESILCATAPLSADLAERLEAQFDACLREVYGCSEVGSMAVRRTANTQSWKKFEGIHFARDSSGNTHVHTEYLPASIMLEDNLEMLPNDRFMLVGRETDQIKIAGKRGSLHEVNAVLNRFEGIVDGVVIFPDQARLVPRLVAIVVLKEGVERNQLRDHFRQFLDSAFVPRPIYVVDALPREENGKLVKASILALYQNVIDR